MSCARFCVKRSVRSFRWFTYNSLSDNCLCSSQCCVANRLPVYASRRSSSIRLESVAWQMSVTSVWSWVTLASREFVLSWSNCIWLDVSEKLLLNWLSAEFRALLSIKCRCKVWILHLRLVATCWSRGSWIYMERANFNVSVFTIVVARFLRTTSITHLQTPRSYLLDNSLMSASGSLELDQVSDMRTL